MKRINHWIDGKAVTGESGRTGPVYDPALGVKAAEVDLASVAEVDLATGAARAALGDWRRSSLGRRTGIMFRFRELLDANRSRLAGIVTSEHGKVLADAMGEIARGIENVEFACGIAQLLKGEHSEQVATGVDIHTLRQPVGVVAGITPFNFPVMVPLWMLANAIACGNTFVLKPSEKDPSASLFMAELLAEAGLPDGVFNVVNGDKEAVDRLLVSPDVDAVSFVGSTPIARYVFETATAHHKRAQALGGAKNHMVVLPDADIGAAADAAISAGYGSAGERCMAVSVVVAVGAVADDVVGAIAERIPSVVVGPGTHPDAQMGPLITAEHRDRVAGYVAEAAGEGATVVIDGRGAVNGGGAVAGRGGEPSPAGYFLGCTLVDHVRPGMRVYDDEVFGPVLSVVRVETYEEAVELVNASPYGNGVALFTRDGGAARQFQFDIQVGMVGINVPVPVPVGSYSFGGWKDSIFGDSPIYGPDGVRFYTRSKVVTSRWPDPATSVIDLGFPTSH